MLGNLVLGLLCWGAFWTRYTTATVNIVGEIRVNPLSDMSVIHNKSKPESVLKKKSNSICYYFVREAIAMCECLTCHISTHKNVTDVLTKVLFGSRRREFVSTILADIYD